MKLLKRRWRALALSAAIVTAVAVPMSSTPTQAQTVISCSHGISNYSKTWSHCTGMYGSQRQQAHALCQGFGWTTGVYWYWRAGNTAANGVFSVAVCNFGGAQAIGSSYSIG
jgi:hypothetical protein